jgi:hypothetical protein
MYLAGPHALGLQKSLMYADARLNSAGDHVEPDEGRHGILSGGPS